jgi:hypothetical protein
MTLGQCITRIRLAILYFINNVRNNENIYKTDIVIDLTN